MANLIKSRPEKKITTEDAIRAMEQIGCAPLPVKNIELTAYLGKFFEQDAIKTLSSAILVRTMEEIRAGIVNCDKMLALDHETLPPEERDSVHKRKIDYINQQLALAKAIQEAAILAGKTVTPQRALTPSFAPGEQVKPVQVNIGIRSEGNVKVDG